MNAHQMDIRILIEKKTKNVTAQWLASRNIFDGKKFQLKISTYCRVRKPTVYSRI